MASFDFNKFESEFKQKRYLQQVAQLLGALRNPADPNERLLPNEPGEPLHAFMEQLQIGTDAPIAEFDFETGNPLTIEEAGRLCRERRVNNAPQPVNLPTMLLTAGQRIYFNTAMQQPETYVEISRPEASDLQSEVAICHFLDGAKTVIDWSESLPNLKRLARERIYTERMTQTALHRLVSRYTPEHSHLVSDMTPNEMANYLLRTETNRDKKAYRRKELFDLVRKPEMDIRAPLTIARRLIDIVYPANRPQMAMQRASAWKMAIISFLPDELAIPISQRLKVASEICQPMTDEELEAMAYQAEEAYRKPPPFPLKFGRTIGSMPVSALIQFNSMENGIENGIGPNYCTPVTEHGRQYQPCHSFLPLADNNNAAMQQEIVRQAERVQQAVAYEQAVVTQQQQQTALNGQRAAFQQQEQEAATALAPRAQSIELHSVDLQISQADRMNRMQHQIECLALTIKRACQLPNL